MGTLVHVLSGLAVGGKERVALDLARRGRRAGMDHRLLLFDTPFRSEEVDFDPGDVPVELVRRGPGLDLRFAWALARTWRRLRVEAVHAHNDTAVFYCALARRLMLRHRPVVVGTFHTRPGHDTRAARALTRWASRRVHAITAVSRDLAEFLQDSGWVHRCEVLANGVDLDAFSPEGPSGGWRAELDVPEGAVVAAHIGRFDPIKRQADLVEAALALEGADVPIVVVLVGVGPTLETVRAATVGLHGVRFVPRVVDVAAFLRDIDVFVLCSEVECAPRVLLEAMACGRAVVSTDVGGVRDILTDETGATCGVLLPAGRVDRLAEALRDLARDRDARRRLGERARERVVVFGADVEWERYSALHGGGVVSC